MNEKPLSTIVVLRTPDDCWAVLDNEKIMDGSPAIPDGSSDDYYFTDADWRKSPVVDRNVYVWAQDIFNGSKANYDYDAPYTQVMYANNVLTTYENAADKNTGAWKDIKATALFKRAYAFYNVSQLFAQPYESTTAPATLGIPLRLSPAINAPTIRSSLSQTYERILLDLHEACNLISIAIPTPARNRPCKAAIYAMLSRVYLSMRRYPDAGNYADSCLRLYNKLIDYNHAPLSFNVANDENLYNKRVPNTEFQSILPSIGYANIDTLLYRSYQSNDLRKQVFFTLSVTGQPRKKSFYDGMSATLYTGLAVDEVYLNRAECFAREGYKDSALKWLNRLLVKRYETGQFQDLQADDTPQALNLILAERRKELVMRGLRWTDLRRLNLDSAHIYLTRIIDGKTYRLEPNSKRYTLPFPPEVIALSGIEQNER